MDGYVERQKLYDLRREVKKDMRDFSRSEMVCEAIREAVKSLPPIRMNCGGKPANRKNVSRELVVGIGDFHFGAKFTVRGLYDEVINYYDSTVFEERMFALADEVCGIASTHNPEMITVMIAGDMLDGMLRQSQLTRLEYGVVDSAIYLGEYLCNWLVLLNEKTGVPVTVYAVRGNHGEIRPLGSKAGQFPEENMERVVMHYMYQRFINDTSILVFDNDAPMHKLVDVCGYNFLLVHGHGSDIESIARDYQNLYNEKIDVFICGHLHKSQTFTAGMSRNGNVLIERVPSICGIDPYAQSKGYGSPPGATVIVMEKGYGRRCVYPVILNC